MRQRPSSTRLSWRQYATLSSGFVKSTARLPPQKWRHSTEINQNQVSLTTVEFLLSKRAKITLSTSTLWQMQSSPVKSSVYVLIASSWTVSSHKSSTLMQPQLLPPSLNLNGRILSLVKPKRQLFSKNKTRTYFSKLLIWQMACIGAYLINRTSLRTLCQLVILRIKGCVRILSCLLRVN